MFAVLSIDSNGFIDIEYANTSVYTIIYDEVVAIILIFLINFERHSMTICSIL